MISCRALLSDVAVGSCGVVNVRAMRVIDRRAIEGRPHGDRSGAVERPLTRRAGPRRAAAGAPKIQKRHEYPKGRNL